MGCLIPATAMCAPLDLWKSKENGEWTIGRHETNDLVLKGMRLSKYFGTFCDAMLSVVVVVLFPRQLSL